jgi:deoxyribonuclease V
MLTPLRNHDWDLAPREAARLQDELAVHVVQEPLGNAPKTVAGIDVSVRGDRVRTAVVVISLPDQEVVEESVWMGDVQFPYVPGLLSFREIPAIIPALERLKTRPDLLMLDGQGRAHPRRFGLACHVGVLYDMPTIGVAKSRLIGVYEEPAEDKGSSADLMDGDERIGLVVRTRDRVKPVYVSVGHRIELAGALKWTLACTDRYKIPEPTRLAHHLSKRTD